MTLATLLIVALLVQTPAGWEATYQRGQQLVLDHKTADAIKLFEAAVKASPGFDGADYTLADTHYMAALEAAMKGPSQDAVKRQHLEAAALHFKRAAELKGVTLQLAVGQLMRLYGEDDLNRPNEVITFARQYVQLSPSSPMGHITLARALNATGQEAAATAAFLGARTAVGADDSLLLAIAILDYVVQTKAGSTADIKALLDYAEAAIDRGLKEDPKDRRLIVARGASALFRAQRETDPARKRVFDAEASRQMERLHELSGPPAATLAFPELPATAATAGSTRIPAAHTQAQGMMSRKQFTAAAGAYEQFVRSNQSSFRRITFECKHCCSPISARRSLRV